MRTRGWGLWRQDWYSICSQHRDYRESCLRCRTGSWHNRIATKIDSLFFRFCPYGWRKWANRKNSPSRKRLESWFPGLKKGA